MLFIMSVLLMYTPVKDYKVVDISRIEFLTQDLDFRLVRLNQLIKEQDNPDAVLDIITNIKMIHLAYAQLDWIDKNISNLLRYIYQLIDEIDILKEALDELKKQTPHGPIWAFYKNY